MGWHLLNSLLWHPLIQSDYLLNPVYNIRLPLTCCVPLPLLLLVDASYSIITYYLYRSYMTALLYLYLHLH